MSRMRYSTVAAGSAPPAPQVVSQPPRYTGMLKVVLIGALVSLAAVAGWRIWGGPPDQELAPVLAQRMLIFADQPGGAIQVVDAQTGEAVQMLRGEQGFLRGVLRSMARDRRAHQVGAYPAFSLALHADSRVILSDPHTGQQLDLAAFGPDNVAVFLRWLPSHLVYGVIRP